MILHSIPSWCPAHPTCVPGVLPVCQVPYLFTKCPTCLPGTLPLYQVFYLSSGVISVFQVSNLHSRCPTCLPHMPKFPINSLHQAKICEHLHCLEFCLPLKLFSLDTPKGVHVPIHMSPHSQSLPMTLSTCSISYPGEISPMPTLLGSWCPRRSA